jgi:ABC-type oligopeptide transport system substrate-binding subunit
MDFWFSCWAAELGFNYSGYCNEEKDGLVYEYLNAPDFESRWEPMFRAQEMLNQDRPIIILAGPLQIQAYRNDRFEFPLDTCYCCQGMYDPPGLFGAVPK